MNEGRSGGRMKRRWPIIDIKRQKMKIFKIQSTSKLAKMVIISKLKF